MKLQLSIVIPALNEAKNLSKLLPEIHQLLAPLLGRTTYEIIIVDGRSRDNTREISLQLGAKVIVQTNSGYGNALVEGFKNAAAEYVLTMDSDLSHAPQFMLPMWHARHEADIVIGSRYIKGGYAKMPFVRKILSRLLNVIFTKGLSLPCRDISSGFRLYKAAALRELSLESRSFDILEEILIRCYTDGRNVLEIPFAYVPRKEGRSHVKLWKFAVSFLRTFWKMWKLRNSIKSADYDERAFNSRIPPQRYWQRQRYKIIMDFCAGAGRVLDVGCGSSRIVRDIKQAIGIDIQMNKVRYMRRYKNLFANATIYALPFQDGCFDCVICSEVIEHLPPGEKHFSELIRVTKPGGRLILGTPDYGTFAWRVIEKLYRVVVPGGYADEHITHYNKRSLTEILQKHGLSVEDTRYVGGAELILLCRKKPQKNP